MSDTDVLTTLWKELKEPLSDIPRWFNHKVAAGDYSKRFVPSTEMLEKIMADANRVGATEEIISDRHYYEAVKAFHSNHTKLYMDTEPGYKFTRCEVEDLRKDGKNGSANVLFSPDGITCEIVGLANRAVNWQIHVYRVRVA